MDQLSLNEKYFYISAEIFMKRIFIPGGPDGPTGPWNHHRNNK